MLNDLKLESLQLRRTSLRLVFLYKVVEGLVPAINPSEFLAKSKPNVRSSQNALITLKVPI